MHNHCTSFLDEGIFKKCRKVGLKITLTAQSILKISLETVMNEENLKKASRNLYKKYVYVIQYQKSIIGGHASTVAYTKVYGDSFSQVTINRSGSYIRSRKLNIVKINSQQKLSTFVNAL